MKYTLLIDGHNFLFRSLYVLPQKKDQLILADKESQDLFISKLSQNINAVIREMEPLVDRCVMVFDSKSWRNDIVSDINYKGTRKQDETIDWTAFDYCYKQFLKELQKFNITTSKSKGAEADDLIFMWSSALIARNIPVIIYTSDKDMLQLVSIGHTGADVLLWSDVTRKLYIPENFGKQNEKVSFLEAFSASGSSIDIYDRFAVIEQSTRKYKLDKIETDCVRFIFNKIITGDKSDNISSVWSYEKNGRIYNITDNKSNKILDKFIEKTGVLNPEYMYNDDTLSVLAETCAELISGSDYNIILKNLKRNIEYMVLSKKVIPEKVISTMVTDIKELAKNLKRVNFDNVKKTEDSVIKKSENIFKNVDDTDMSFIKKPEKSLF